MWGKEHRDDQQELVESWIDRNAVPDAIGYYPTIFIMHVAVVLLLLIGSLLALLNNPSTHAFILFALTFLTVIWFSLSALKWRPNRYPPVVTLVLIYLFVGNGPGGVPQICQEDQILLEEGD
jgi:hypothetical protein